MATAKKKTTATVTQDAADLHGKLAELRRDLGDHSRSLAANELPNPQVIKITRREIARTLTAINAERLAKKRSATTRKEQDDV